MPIFALEYTYVDSPDDLTAHRPAHRAFLAGELPGVTILSSGPYTGPGGAGALLILRADSAEDLLATMDQDPFHQLGLIPERSVHEWTPVNGPWAT
ncbi:hypothetical protein JL107_00240 [Nakamurella flavida]|uniref:YCII-related domain-containing protein n=1 Tax=Nakamurella flavida TaxID=363630 RepID=A0A938YL08_9ACTN|nr:YciI family protein [Nakamurella flavida]MBM9474865.1 hypothetical protein [Nakamurella flavida]MDP9776435.1 uncharacterized protein YciI [Nakamurella flavida]